MKSKKGITHPICLIEEYPLLAQSMQARWVNPLLADIND